MQDGAFPVAQGNIVQRQRRFPGWGMTGRRKDLHQIRCPQPHLLPLCLGQPAELRRREDALDRSPIQVYDPVRYVHQVVEPVLRNQNGLSLPFDQPQMLPQFLDGGHVQIGGRFIQQVDLRIHGIDGGESDLLLFPAGQLEDIAAAQALDVQVFRRLLHPLRQFSGRPGLILDAEGDLAVRVHVKKLRSGILEHRADLGGDLVRGEAADLLAIHPHAAGQLACIELGDQSVHQPCDGGLAAPAPPAKQDALPVRNGQVNVPEAVMLLSLVGEGHPSQFDHPNTPFP